MVVVLNLNYKIIYLMDFKEMLRKMSFPLRNKQNEDDEIKAEEKYINETLSNVNLYFIYVL